MKSYRILSLTLFEKYPINQMLAKTHSNNIQKKDENQPFLFG